jgi:hypothetical protein
MDFGWLLLEFGKINPPLSIYGESRRRNPGDPIAIA